MGNGLVTMSNIFLSTALITLAQIEIGCHDENIECGKVYGYKPSSLITIIGTVSGLLSAILLPFMGAIVDCTSTRRAVGIIACILLMSVQAIQINTTQNTWFAMAILQAVNGFIFQVVALASFSYLPEIGRLVGAETMTKYSAEWSVLMFGMEVCYLVAVIGISLGMQLDDIATGQLGQAINVPASSVCYYLAWKFFSTKKARRQLSDQETLIGTGFKQVFRTASGISKHYGPSLGWFLLATTFAEAAANAFVLVAVTYLKEVMAFSASEIGILFFVVIVFTIPGSIFGAWLTRKTCPQTAMKLQLVSFIVVNFIAFILMTNRDQAKLAYFFGILWGLLLGWFYPTESLIFSMIVPEGQEAELAGFFLYCTQILGWLPPLVFTMMNERGIPLQWGGIHLNLYLMVALLCYHFMAPWDDCIAAAQWNKMLSDANSVSSNDSKKNLGGIEMDSLTARKGIFVNSFCVT